MKTLLFLFFAVTIAAIARAGEPVSALLNASDDRIVQRTFVPSAEQKVGEVRLIVRGKGGEANVVQTLLYTKVLSRVVGEIRKKESANWPPTRTNHADSMRYLDALDQVRKTIWSRTPKDRQVADRRQRMIIEHAVGLDTAVVMVGTYEMTESNGEVTVTRREPLVTLDLARDYVRQNMRLIAADSFRVTEADLESLLRPLKMVQ